MSDPGNVSRFPTPPRQTLNWSDPRVQVITVYALGAISFWLFMSGRSFADLIGFGIGVAAIAIAAGKRDEGPGWARTHFEFGLRTFIITGAIWVLLSLSLILIITAPLVWIGRWALGLWLIVRVVVGVVRALDRKPINDPRTMLI